MTEKSIMEELATLRTAPSARAVTITLTLEDARIIGKMLMQDRSETGKAMLRRYSAAYVAGLNGERT